MATCLSTPLGQLRDRYDVVVIGSGYGGAIVARRLAIENPHLTIGMLERGLEIRPGEYPISIGGALAATQTDSRLGHVGRRTSMFDVHVEKELTVLVGCGLGGTSLINASVMVPPAWHAWPEEVVARWPKALREPGTRAELTSLAYKTRAILGAKPRPKSLLPNALRLEKANQLNEASRLTNGAGGVRLPASTEAPIAVTFHTHVNAQGVQQARCTLCGNCMTGCNYSAKNTLIMNFLPEAAKLGVGIFCGVRVDVIEPPVSERPRGDWTIHATLETRAGRVFGRPTHLIRAGAVFLAAGSLGSTEILLRSRQRFGLELSPALGEHFSGNGDIIAFGYDMRSRVNGFGFGTSQPIRMATGPTITAMIDARDTAGLLIQEGAVPGSIATLMRLVGPFIARLGRVPRAGEGFSFKRIVREVDSLVRGAQHGTLARTQTYLAMGLDDGAGRMGLVKNRLRIRWLQVTEQDRLKQMNARLAELTAALGGMHVNAISQRVFGARQFIAHPLGGCAMADDSGTGVVDDLGRVFRHRDAQTAVYPGLYVSDGAIVPTPLGSNPALTIAALSERIARAAAMTLSPRAAAIPSRVARIDSSVPGLRYGEHLAGKLRVAQGDLDVDLHLTLCAEDFAKLMRRSQHELNVIGSMRTPGLGVGLEHWTISEGTLRVLIADPDFVDTKLLVYEAVVTSTNGTRYWLRGHKTISPSSVRRRLWETATRLPFVLLTADPQFTTSTNKSGTPTTVQHEEVPYNGCSIVEKWIARPASVFEDHPNVAGAGIAGGRLIDVVRMALSMEVLYEPLLRRRLLMKFRYAWFFVNGLVQARVWALRHTVAINPLGRDVAGDPPRDKAQVFWDEQKRFKLTRFRGPDGAQAVLLIPGFAMSTYWFRAKLKHQNVTQFLLEKGYDVWLLDYRASNRLPTSLEQFDLDVLAKEDIPAAIARVYQETGQKVQVVAHCVGSILMTMALLSGMVGDRLLDSAVLSQSFAFIDQPWPNRLKAGLRLAQWLKFLGFRPLLSTQFDQLSSLGARILDRLLYFYPSRERCTSGVCRRLLLVYGEAIRHDEMDADAHEKLYDMVDVGNLTTLSQLQRMSLKRRIVDAKGDDTYVTPENFNRIGIPLTLIQGEKNNLFRRSGAEKTITWLHDHGGFSTEEQRRKNFTLEILEGFGHLDVFVGKRSVEAVYERIADALVRMQGLPRS